MTIHTDQPLGESEGQARANGGQATQADENQNRQSHESDDAELLEALDGEVIPPGEGDDEGEDFEVEHQGKKFRLPKAAQPLVMMNKDYTQKTQALSDDRRGFETERTQFNERVQAAGKTVQERAQLAAIDMGLAEFKKVDWNALNQQDPQKFNELRLQYENLAGQRHALANQIQKAEDGHIAAQRDDFAKRQHQTRAANERDIPGWSVEKDAHMVGQAQRFYGLSIEQMLPASADPVLYRVLWDAVQMRSLLAKRASQPRPKTVDTPEPQPAAKVSGNRPSGKAGPQDNQSIDTWMKGRNTQVAERRRAG
jgi:hypothetical protein